MADEEGFRFLMSHDLDLDLFSTSKNRARVGGMRTIR